MTDKIANENVTPEAKSNEDSELTAGALAAYEKLARERDMLTYKVETLPISGVGENSYGQVLQVKMTPISTLRDQKLSAPFFSVIKMAPKQLNRRKFTRVVDYYRREVFIYEHVLRSFAEVERAYALPTEMRFDQPPEMLYYSLEPLDEFIIFEDLQQQHYAQNPRFNTPNFNLVEKALISLARMHAMSFVLQTLRPEQFLAWVTPMDDNLFSNMLPFSVEFGKRHVDCTREMMKTERAKKKVLELEIKPVTQQHEQQHERQQFARRRGSIVCDKLLNLLNVVHDDFERICLRCVDGQSCAPYAVICHGDFWNNNIMYHFNAAKKATSAKLIDFQMSRYASPILDVVHFLFSCTEKELRDQHFPEFLNIYYKTLSEHLHHFKLDSDKIFPRRIFEQQLRYYGVYGFCMSVFCVPFFISTASETIDLDEVSTWAAKISNKLPSSPVSSEEENMTSDSEAENTDATMQLAQHNSDTEETEEERICRQKLQDYQVLTERTLPIFKKRMFGIVVDLVQYDVIDMVETISQELPI